MMVTCISNAVNCDTYVIAFVKRFRVQEAYFVKFRTDCFDIEVADNDTKCSMNEEANQEITKYSKK